MENQLLKKFCLYNYFDNAAQEKISDFTINFCKPHEDLKPEEFKSHFEQLELLKSNRGENEISIHNPEYVLTKIVEKSIDNLFDGMKTKPEVGTEDLQQTFSQILKGIHLVQGKIEKLTARNELLENNLRKKVQEKRRDESSESDVEEGECLKNLGTRTSMEIMNDLVKEGTKAFSHKSLAKKDGYLISFAEFQAINFLMVNYTILSEEFNNIYQSSKEMKQFKVDFEQNKASWWRKVECNAGDVQDLIKTIREENEGLNQAIQDTQLFIQRIKKENEVYRKKLSDSSLEFDFEQVRTMIEASEKEQIDLRNFLEEDRELQIKLMLRRKTIETEGFGDVKDIANFFEKREKYSFADQKLLKKIQDEQKEEAHKSVIQLLLEQRVLNHGRLKNVEFQVPEILEYLEAENQRPLSDFYEMNLTPFIQNDESKVLFSIINTKENQNYLIFDKKEKHPINLFLLEDNINKKQELLMFSNQMLYIVSIDLKQIEAFIIKQDNSNIFALQLKSQPNVLIETSSRTALLVHLISCFEMHNLNKFKIYHSENITTKEQFDIESVALGSYEKRVDAQELEEKRIIVKNLLKTKMQDLFNEDTSRLKQHSKSMIFLAPKQDFTKLDFEENKLELLPEVDSKHESDHEEEEQDKLKKARTSKFIESEPSNMNNLESQMDFVKNQQEGEGGEGDIQLSDIFQYFKGRESFFDMKIIS